MTFYDIIDLIYKHLPYIVCIATFFIINHIIKPSIEKSISQSIESKFDEKLEIIKSQLKTQEHTQSTIQDLLKSNASSTCERNISKKIQAAEDLLTRRLPGQKYLIISDIISIYKNKNITYEDLRRTLLSEQGSFNFEKYYKIDSFIQNETMNLYLTNRPLKAFEIYLAITRNTASFAYITTLTETESIMNNFAPKTTKIDEAIENYIKTYYDRTIKVTNTYEYHRMFYLEIMNALRSELPELNITPETALESLKKSITMNFVNFPEINRNQQQFSDKK